MSGREERLVTLLISLGDCSTYLRYLVYSTQGLQSPIIVYHFARVFHADELLGVGQIHFLEGGSTFVYFFDA